MTRRTVATLSIAALGLAIGVAVLPFIFGLLGAPILAVTFAPLYGWLRRHTGPRRAAAGAVVAGILAIFVPAVAITLLLINELPAVLAGGEVSRVLAAVESLRVGPFAFGENLAAASADVFTWVSRQAMSMIGGLTFVAINLLIAFMGLYFLLRGERSPWRYVERYSPFSAATTKALRVRFHDVTRATILGIGATALVQGVIIGGSFVLVGLPHALLWGTVTGIASVLPVFGSSLVWLPGTALLVIDHRYADAAILGSIGILIASNIDNVIRPIVFRRVSDVHPLVAVVGAFAGMRLFGLIGLLLGPLALVYFLELLRAYDREVHSAPAARDA